VSYVNTVKRSIILIKQVIIGIANVILIKPKVKAPPELTYKPKNDVATNPIAQKS